MIDVASNKGVATFIHTSSISAWGSATGSIDENTPQQAENSWINYERTKWLGEQEALKGIEKGIKVVIINPGSIVGSFDTTSWARMFFALRDGEVPGVPPGDNSFVHVDDVVQAHILAVEKGKNGHNYLATGENTSIQALVEEMVNQLGLQKTPPSIPVFVLKLVAKFGAITSIFTGKEPTMTPEIVEFMSRKGISYSNAKALNELGYQSKPWQTGVKESYEWLKEEGLL
jgi:dihydroflavonol-4-reductase